MCAQYQVEAEVKRLAKVFGRPFEGPEEWKPRVVPYGLAPVAVGDHIQLMQYSLIPSWSKEPKVKFATYNARIESILEKPTWKKPFVQHHCVVPITKFVEPIYTGDYAGNMVAFGADDLLLAAGIFDEWKDKKTGSVLRSFALVMGEPIPFVGEVGHDRTPIFMSKEHAEEWLKNEKDQGEQLRTFLLEVAEEPNLRVEIDRPMAKGWEKRIPKE